MKVPLRFQLTEYDCGSVSLLNALSFLYEREEIPAMLVKAISLYTLDCYDEEGNLGHGGTSREAIAGFSKWMKKYCEEHDFGLMCTHLLKENVTMEAIIQCIKEGGCVYIRTFLSDEHYSIITKVSLKYIYLFDPYYLNLKYYDKEKQIKIILNHPFEYNRRVSKKRMNQAEKKDFCLGPIEFRECLLLKRTK